MHSESSLMVLSEEGCALINILKLSLQPFYEEWKGKREIGNISRKAYQYGICIKQKSPKVSHDTSVKELESECEQG